ncbi:hypothetical protein MMC11_001814 [Xylographa trunciseda]|nr:hypothetical protein [Xylographa trunciseda]
MTSRQAKAAHRKSGGYNPSDWQNKVYARRALLLTRAEQIKAKQDQAKVNKQKRDKKRAKEMEARLERGLPAVEERYMSPRQTRMHLFLQKGGAAGEDVDREDADDTVDEAGDDVGVDDLSYPDLPGVGNSTIAVDPQQMQASMNQAENEHHKNASSGSPDANFTTKEDWQAFESSYGNVARGQVEPSLPKQSTSSRVTTVQFPQPTTQFPSSPLFYKTSKKHARSSSPASQHDDRLSKRRRLDLQESSPEVFLDEGEWPPTQRDASTHPASRSPFAQLASVTHVHEAIKLNNPAKKLSNHEEDQGSGVPISNTAKSQHQAGSKLAKVHYPTQTTAHGNASGHLDVPVNPAKQLEYHAVTSIDDLAKVLLAEMAAEDADFGSDEEYTILSTQGTSQVAPVVEEVQPSSGSAILNIKNMPAETNLAEKSIPYVDKVTRDSDESGVTDIISMPIALQETLPGQGPTKGERTSHATGHKMENVRLFEAVGISMEGAPTKTIDLPHPPAEYIGQDNDQDYGLSEKDNAFMADIVFGNLKPSPSRNDTADASNIIVSKPLRECIDIAWKSVCKSGGSVTEKIQTAKSAGSIDVIDVIKESSPEKKNLLLKERNANKLNQDEGFETSEEDDCLLAQILLGNIKPDKKATKSGSLVPKQVQLSELPVYPPALEDVQIPNCQYRTRTTTKWLEANPRQLPLTTMEQLKLPPKTSEDLVKLRHGSISTRPLLHEARFRKQG